MEISIEALGLLIAGIGLLLAWLGYSNNKRQKDVEQAKVDTAQHSDIEAVTESLKCAWTQIHKIDEDMRVLVDKIGDLDKAAALNNNNIAQLTKEMDRLVEMHGQLYSLMSDLFKTKDVIGSKS